MCGDGLRMQSKGWSANIALSHHDRKFNFMLRTSMNFQDTPGHFIRPVDNVRTKNFAYLST
jgi:hypothetical protein